MLRGPERLAFDGVFSLGILYASVWVYEASNFAVLFAAGDRPSLDIQGLLPEGIVASSDSNAAFFLKLLQTMVCLSVVLALWVSIRKRNLTGTKIALVTTGSAYLASFQWELLPPVTFGSEMAHGMVFLLTTLAIGFLVSFMFLRPLRATGVPSRPYSRRTSSDVMEFSSPFGSCDRSDSLRGTTRTGGARGGLLKRGIMVAPESAPGLP